LHTSPYYYDDKIKWDETGGPCSAHEMKNAFKILVEISSSHGGGYEVQNCLLGCTAV
jgi:hypothetical protein